ncbi:MAG: Kelch repeat-containing protein [Candidatus Dormibacteria bacterium]
MQPGRDRLRQPALLFLALLTSGLAGALGNPVSAVHASNVISQPGSFAGTSLPWDLYQPASASTGRDDFIFGGSDACYPQCGWPHGTQVLDYSYDTNRFSVVATLPFPLSGAAAVYTGTYIYLFGGWWYDSTTGAHYSANVFRFDPTTHALNLDSAVLPTPMYQMSIAWSGTYAYMFGGTVYSAGTPAPSAAILRFDPATDTVITTPTVFDAAVTGTSAVWAGNYAYIFGGELVGQDVDSVIRFDPAQPTVSTVSHLFDTVRQTSAFFDGTYAWIYGGDSCDQLYGCIVTDFNCSNKYCATIQRYDPATNAMSYIGNLPEARSGATVAFDGRKAFLVGGSYSTQQCSGYGGCTWVPTGVDDVLRIAAGSGSIFNIASSLPNDDVHGFWYQNKMYLLGHDDERWDPATSGLELLDTRVYGSGGMAFDGTHAWFLGGTGVGPMPILEYDPSNDTTAALAVTLPNAPWPAATWAGGAAWMIGGGSSTAIYRFDPVTMTVTTMASVLPAPRQGAVAVWDSPYIYILGGNDGTSDRSEIFRYDPVADVLTQLATTLPSGRSNGAADLLHGWIYYFGGNGGASTVVGIDPVGGTSEVMFGSLPWGVVNEVASARNGYIYTGAGGGGFARFDAAPTPPQTISATANDGAHQIEVDWSAAPANGYGPPLTAYKLYAGNAAGGESLAATLSPGSLSYTESPSSSTRFYRVSAVNADGEGAFSAEVSAVLTSLNPSPPQNVNATFGSPPTSVLVTWSAPASSGGYPLVGYRVFRGSKSNGEVQVGTVHASTTSYTDSGCLGQCYYKVQAVNMYAQSPLSAEVWWVGA